MSRSLAVLIVVGGCGFSAPGGSNGSPDSAIGADSDPNVDAPPTIDGDPGGDAMMLDAAMLDAAVPIDAAPVVPTAYRFTKIEIHDPHLLGPDMQQNCDDFTNDASDAITHSLTSDERGGGTNGQDPDGLFDYSIVVVMRPLTSTGATDADLYFGTCSKNPEACVAGNGSHADLALTSLTSGTCFTPTPGQKPYTPAVGAVTAPCFSSGVVPAVTLPVRLFGFISINIPLKDVTIAAKYGTGELTGGVLQGFLYKADAQQVTTFGSHHLDEVLADGTNHQNSCPSSAQNDQDTHNTMPGWWFYIPFTAVGAGWSD